MFNRKALAGLFGTVALAAFATPASAQLVTYSWTTTSQGFGPTVGQPTFATFQVALSAVQTGIINYADITNIQMGYPGLTFDAYTQSSTGLDNKVYVDPTTGALVYNNINQGLAVAGYEGGLFSGSFLSITIGDAYGPNNVPQTVISDGFNALKNWSPIAGFPTAGYWTATLPQVTPSVPEPASWAMMIAGFGLIGGAMRRRSVKVAYA